MGSLLDGFLRHASTAPETLAIHVGETDYSYGELARMSFAVAHWLDSKIHERSARVAILGSRSIEVYAGILGCLLSGKTYVPLNPKLPKLKLEALLAQAKAELAIVDPVAEKSHVPELKDVLPEQIFLSSELSRNNLEYLPQPINPMSLAYIIFTSGSTGQAKGVMISRSNLSHFIDCTRLRYQIQSSDRFSQFSEISFDVSTFDILGALNSGGSLHVVPEAELLSPGDFIRRRKITIWFSVPSVISNMSKLKMLGAGTLPTLRLSLFSGEALNMDMARAWYLAAPNSVIENLYGPTELTVDCCAERLDRDVLITSERKVISLGKPFPKMYGAVVDLQGKFVQPDQHGELVFCGPQVAQGYFEQPELSAERFRTLIHPELGPRTWYLTGDLGYQDRSGNFHWLGRVDNQIKLMGHRIELEEIDCQLRESCGCREAATVPWPVKDGTIEGVVSFVTGENLEPRAIREELKKRLAPVAVPKKIIVLSALPYSANGKIDRKALVARLKAEGI